MVELEGKFLKEHKTEIINRIKNEEKRTLRINPLERIMKIDDNGDTMTVSTTTERLAQKLGKDIYKSYSGKLEFHWSKNNKFVRVNWKRDT